MTSSLLHDAFEHHTWATLRIIDACLPLSDEQLQATVPGTYGSIIDTARHLVGADVAYLFVVTGGRVGTIDEDAMDLPALREVASGLAAEWRAVLGQDPDPDRDVVRHRDDGSESHATLGIRLAQVLHHGTDHRSQLCTALTTLGVEPPEIDVWAYGREVGRAFMTEPTA